MFTGMCNVQTWVRAWEWTCVQAWCTSIAMACTVMACVFMAYVAITDRVRRNGGRPDPTVDQQCTTSIHVATRVYTHAYAHVYAHDDGHAYAHVHAHVYTHVYTTLLHTCLHVSICMSMHL